MKTLRIIIGSIVWTVIGLYLALLIFLNLPFVQQRMGVWVASALRETIGSEVAIGRLDLGLLNRVVIDNVRVKDQSGKEMLVAPRLAVGVSLSDLMHGQITITSAQIFGLKASLYKEDDQPANFQFLIDAFSSDNTDDEKPFDLQISSLIIRRSEVIYNDFDVKNISAHIIVNRFTNDSINLEVKKLSLEEVHGLQLTQLAVEYVANDSKTKTLTFSGALSGNELKLSDFAFLEPKLEPYSEPIKLSALFSGTDSILNVPSFAMTVGEDLSLALNGSWHYREGAANADFQLNTTLLEQLGAMRAEGSVCAVDSFKNIQADLKLNSELVALTALVNKHGDYYNAQAKIDSIEYNSHVYNDLSLNGAGTLSNFDINAQLDDEFAKLNLQASVNGKQWQVNSKVNQLNPNALHLIDKWEGSAFTFNLNATGRGSVVEKISLLSDFANVTAEGACDINTISESIKSFIKCEPARANNKFNLYATLAEGEAINSLFNVPLTLHSPAHLVLALDDEQHKLNINLDSEKFNYNGKEFKDLYAIVTSPNNTLRVKANALNYDENGNYSQLTVSAKLDGQEINSSIEGDIKGKHRLRTKLNSVATLDPETKEIRVQIQPSTLKLDENQWDVAPATAAYTKGGALEISNFELNHEDQFIKINGKAQKQSDEKIQVALNQVDVAYILDFVNFHAVEFDGDATGTVLLSQLFDNPQANADLKVTDFHFERGLLGTLNAKANWNLEQGAINIDAQVNCDEVDSLVYQNSKILIDGYVSPKEAFIDLHIRPDNAPVNFISKYTKSFLENFELHGTGHLNVYGPLKEIQLLGEAKASGHVSVIPLKTTYTLENQHVAFVPNDIQLLGDTIRDRDNHYAILNAHIRHKKLKNITYEVDIDAHNVLCLDIKEFGNDVVKGTIYATGSCHVQEQKGGTIINIDATANKGSFIAYNAAKEATVGSNFIKYRDRNAVLNAPKGSQTSAFKRIASDLFINFTIHATPDATLILPMDEAGNEQISLYGNGLLTATLYNKGAFDLFGNLDVQGGEYKMVIQKVLRRNFAFQPGGTIAFGGDPFDAQVNLEAKYTLNSVPLNDLNISQSFKNNNVRVDCIMNIRGIAGDPRVDFDFDLPTVGNETKQMIRSLIRDNEELNQQVIYLIAIGRFLNSQESNESARYSQTSLAMQSIISGTLSQQISRVLDNFIDSSNWNFGANISTGDEGFYNAEYEGLISGQMLNNRLLFNGQFGYRDNPNATSSFIGDFDLRYLLTPSGNTAVRVYNQTNNKYFINNTLTTQGVGFVFKRQF